MRSKLTATQIVAALLLVAVENHWRGWPGEGVLDTMEQLRRVVWPEHFT